MDGSANGFGSQPLYATTSGQNGPIYIARRQRILGVRISVFMQAEENFSGSAAGIHLINGATSFQVQNHLVTGLDPERNYILRELVYDPINFRNRDILTTVNNAPLNQSLMSGASCEQLL